MTASALLCTATSITNSMPQAPQNSNAIWNSAPSVCTHSRIWNLCAHPWALRNSMSERRLRFAKRSLPVSAPSSLWLLLRRARSGVGSQLRTAILLATYASWRVASMDRSGDYETMLAAEIVNAHLRSLQPGHLTDVVSTDQHTVKPWFDGKLDFSPPVQDFGDQGFPLQGARVDVVHGHTVAALVYARRNHFVNVFIWPADEQDRAPSSGSQQGYQWLEWRKGGMEFCAVSDAPKPALEQLQILLASN